MVLNTELINQLLKDCQKSFYSLDDYTSDEEYHSDIQEVIREHMWISQKTYLQYRDRMNDPTNTLSPSEIKDGYSYHEVSRVLRTTLLSLEDYRSRWTGEFKIFLNHLEANGYDRQSFLINFTKIIIYLTCWISHGYLHHEFVENDIRLLIREMKDFRYNDNPPISPIFTCLLDSIREYLMPLDDAVEYNMMADFILPILDILRENIFRDESDIHEIVLLTRSC